MVAKGSWKGSVLSLQVGGEVTLGALPQCRLYLQRQCKAGERRGEGWGGGSVLSWQVGGGVTLRSLPQSRLDLQGKARQWIRVGGREGGRVSAGFEDDDGSPQPPSGHPPCALPSGLTAALKTAHNPILPTLLPFTPPQPLPSISHLVRRLQV